MCDAAPLRRLLASIVAAAILAATVGVAVAPAAASDQVATVSPSTGSASAAPGETFEVDVAIRAGGGHHDEGVAAVALVARYHPDYLEIADVEAGPWLAGGEETTVRAAATLAHEDGTAILEQRREPPAGGVTGEGRLATLTVAVAEDAPPSTATISFGETAVDLANEQPMPVYDRELAVEIDGGGEAVEPFDHPDPAAVEDESRDVGGPDGVEASADGDLGDGASAGDEDEGRIDPIGSLSLPESALLTFAVAFAVALAVQLRRS